jgi:predicted NUDIX family NTP pyrophosphohydrolase
MGSTEQERMNLVATSLAAGDVPSWVSIHVSQQKISQLQRPMLSDKPRNPCN